MQGCYPRKGTVFVNKFDRYDSCREAYMLYVLYEKHSQVGFGLFGVGYGTPGPLRDWYTHATGKPLKELLPAPPPCLEDLKRFNFTSIHVFLVDNPKRITCPKCSAWA
ncbi:uncharacterized protein [Halyomorpha halys]|uniref:uncharacterized protein n=1 Tax=Halyomorpha halys TaxID=286706 RepID=UPI0006D526A7|nr:uncharacterized protein LOC106681189 [Halyomorpha halys]